MITGKTENINRIIGVILSLAFVVFSFSAISFFEKIEVGIYDLGSSLSHDDNLNTDKLALIEIDDESLDNLGPWPWPRGVIAEMIDMLSENGAQVIGLDIPVYEVEKNEGLEEIRGFREKFDAYPGASVDMSLKKWVFETIDQIDEKLDNDASLLKSIQNAGNVILPVYTYDQTDINRVKTGDESFILKSSLDDSAISSSVKSHTSKDRLLFPIADFGNNAAGVGVAATAPMSLSYLRSYPAYINYNGVILPSFPVMIAASYLGLTPDDLIVKDSSILLKERSVPLTKGEMFIKFSGEEKRYSFADVKKMENIPADVFKGKIVLIGLNDNRSRTMDMPGVTNRMQLNALLLENIISSGSISRPSFMSYLEALLIIIAGIAVSFVSSLSGRTVRHALVAGIFLFVISAGLILLATMGLWLKTVYIAACVVSVYLSIGLKDFVMSGFFRQESPEDARLLGITYQTKGHLDQAFRKFKRLPTGNETKELIYNVALEYENKNRIDKALEAYDYLSGLGGYLDVEERISRLKGSDDSAIKETFHGIGEKDRHVDSGERPRTRIGRYEIIDVLGKGSMGLVYKAQDPKINRMVAIKTIRFSDEFEEDLIQEIKERFFREAEIAGQLSHPSIVTIHDVGEDGDLTYMAMEFLEGEDLDRYITNENLLSFRRVLDIVARIAEALDYAHKANVIHRDIKPANVMLLKNGNIKVTDFGIAKAISSSRTKTGIILGTPNYMSPEQIMGQKIDSRSDIFSLGVLFYQLITGELPFHGDNLSGLLYQITQIKHPSPRSHNPKIPGICEQILDKALAKDPDKRFRSAGELSRVINALGQRIDQMRIEKSSIK